MRGPQRDWGSAVFLTRGKTAARAANMVAESMPRVEVIRPAGGHAANDRSAGIGASDSSRSTCTRWSPGYLKTQAVDIGSRIRERRGAGGDRRAAGRARPWKKPRRWWQQAKAQIAQAEARIKTMEGERDAAAAAVKEAESDVDRLIAARDLAQKQLARVTRSGRGACG